MVAGSSGNGLGGRHDRSAHRDRQIARSDLVAQRAHGLGCGPDEDDPVGGTCLGELGALREEAVARVDRIDFVIPGDADHLVDVEIGLERALALADPVGLVGLEPVQGELVLLGVDRDGLDAELGRGPEHPDRDLRTVGGEQAADRVRCGAGHRASIVNWAKRHRSKGTRRSHQWSVGPTTPTGRTKTQRWGSGELQRSEYRAASTV